MSRTTALAVILLVVTAGCTASEFPVVPVSDSSGPAVTRNSESFAPRALWGYWEWIVDIEAGTFEAVQLRTAMLHFNVSKPIDSPPAKISFTNFQADKPNNTIRLDVSLTHPYPGKPNLTGFDVRGIFIGPGSLKKWGDQSIVTASATEPHMLNPDGFTRWWNPVEFQTGDNILSYRDGAFGIKNGKDGVFYTATLNGYKLFSDDLGPNEDAGNLSIPDRCTFSTGKTNTRHYEIWFPKSGDKFVFHYNYAVDACWAPIPGYEPGSPVSVPSDFPITANQPEPFRVVPEIVENSLYFVSGSVKGGSALLRVRVYDWQGYLGSGNVASEVSSLQLEVPSALDTTFAGSVLDPGAGTMAYAEYEVVIDGAHLTASGDHEGLLTAVSASGDYQPQLTGYSGTAPLSTYAFFVISVSNVPPAGNNPPVAVATADKTVITAGESVLFDASASYDPDGFLVPPYQWDFNGDGIYGDPFDGGTHVKPSKVFNVPGVYAVDLKVTDDDDAADTLKTPVDETITITVNPQSNQPPIAAASADKTQILVGEQVTFDGSLSSDPDGTVVSWEWDFNNDGLYGDPFDGGTMQVPVKQFNQTGEFVVDLRVTDDDGASDILDQKITVYVSQQENLPPVAVAQVVGSEFWEETPVEFDASASYDPDGTVTQWLWDFDNDGFFGDPIDGGTPQNPLKIFGPGAQTVNLRVVDDGFKSDTLDTPITFFVQSHVAITLAEDQAYKSANGYKYLPLPCAVPGQIPVDYTNPNGPWDFTGAPYLTDPDYVVILPPSDPEVAPYIPAYFPDSTDYFIRYDVHGLGIDGYIYLAEEPDFTENVLKLHGHMNRKTSSTTMEIVPYNEETGGPVVFEFPWTVNMDEKWTISYKQGAANLLKFDYREVGIGEGYCTVPFGGSFTARALLTRTFLEVSVGNTVGLQALLYKWTADDGTQLARLYAFNSLTETNFDPNTFQITGVSRVTVLSEKF